jgi:flagellar biosynthetic protein FliQ
MSDADMIALIRDSVMVTLKIGGPLLGAALLSGLVISIFQAVTQINEATLVFLPKVIAIGLVIVLMGSFMMTTLTTFSRTVFDQIVAIGGS